MPRPRKDLSDADLSLIFTAAENGFGRKAISQAVSFERKAWAAVGRTYRERYVSPDTIRRVLQVCKTEGVQNPGQPPKTDPPRKTDVEVDIGSTKPQAEE